MDAEAVAAAKKQATDAENTGGAEKHAKPKRAEDQTAASGSDRSPKTHENKTEKRHAKAAKPIDEKESTVAKKRVKPKHAKDHTAARKRKKKHRNAAEPPPDLEAELGDIEGIGFAQLSDNTHVDAAASASKRSSRQKARIKRGRKLAEETEEATDARKEVESRKATDAIAGAKEAQTSRGAQAVKEALAKGALGGSKRRNKIAQADDAVEQNTSKMALTSGL